MEVGVDRAHLYLADTQYLHAAIADVAAAVPVAVGAIADMHRALAAGVDADGDVQLVAVGAGDRCLARSIERHRLRFLARLARGRGVRTDAVLFGLGDLRLPN